MSDRWIIDGLKQMLKSGDVSSDMSFSEIQKKCEEPDLHEFDDLGVMLQNWEMAKQEFRRELMPLKVSPAAKLKDTP